MKKEDLLEKSKFFLSHFQGETQKNLAEVVNNLLLSGNLKNLDNFLSTSMEEGVLNPENNQKGEIYTHEPS